ncbi:hypothetical protein [Rhizobium yanglingense]
MKSFTASAGATGGAWIAKFLGIDKWLVQGAAILLAASLVFFAGYKVYDGIYDRGYGAASAKFTAEIAELNRQAADARAKEIERQDAANNAAKEREAARIAEMQAANESLQNKIEELQREADQILMLASLCAVLPACADQVRHERNQGRTPLLECHRPALRIQAVGSRRRQ